MAKFHKITGCFVPPHSTRRNLQQLRPSELVELRAALPFSGSLIAAETGKIFRWTSDLMQEYPH